MLALALASLEAYKPADNVNSMVGKASQANHSYIPSGLFAKSSNQTFFQITACSREQSLDTMVTCPVHSWTGSRRLRASAELISVICIGFAGFAAACAILLSGITGIIWAAEPSPDQQAAVAEHSL